MAATWIAPAQKKTPDDPHAIEACGVVLALRQQWPNADGSVTVLADLADGTAVRGRAEGKGELRPGGEYRFFGRWVEHARYGWQFLYDLALAEAPDDPYGVAAYLARHADRVGPVAAAKLVAAYGREAARVLCDEPERPVRDGLLSEADAGLASLSLRRVYVDPAAREAHVALFGIVKGMGFPGKMLAAALRRWRNSAPEVVRRDPFKLLTAGMPGAGFLRCDRLYSSLKLPQRRLKRQSLAAWYALEQLQGDTWAQASRALQAVREQIGGTEPRERRAVALLCRASLAECRTDGGGVVWLADRQKATDERAAAHHLRRLMSADARWPDVGGVGLHPLNDAHQFAAINSGVTGPVSLLTGGPGTGKTHCAALIVRGLCRLVGAQKVAVCAPTGKAAVRINQKLAEAKLPVQARTIHALLAVRSVDGDDEGFSFGAGETHPLDFRYVVIDEASMVDASLMAALLRAVPTGTHLLFVGDVHQLPPVGHGAPLRDMIAAGLPRAHLSEVRRNSGLIVSTCHQIAAGRLPHLPQSLEGYSAEQNLVHLGVDGDGPDDRQRAVQDRIDATYEWLEGESGRLQPPGTYDPIDDVQVICARNSARQQLNLHLQARLNPGPSAGRYRPGDKVICLRNGWAMSPRQERVYVANGDIGRLIEVREQVMVVRLRHPDRTVAVPTGASAAKTVDAALSKGGERVAGQWDLAYAVTCHKYQGSEVPVAIVVADGAGRLGSREWLYTALSRAKSLCVAVADRSDLRRCVDRVTLSDRKTFLVEQLKEGA